MRRHGRRACPHDAAPASRRLWLARWRLQRRIFLWFGLAILATGAAVAVAFSLTGASSARRDWNAVQTFAGARFERVWDDPGARDELARSVHDSLRADVSVEDAAGRVLTAHGKCRGRARIEVPVLRAGVRVGTVGVCPERRHDQGLRLAFGLGCALLVLWGVSHVVARRLSLPLVEIGRVAQDIAGGDLAARVDLGVARGADERLVASTLNDMAARVERQIADYRALLAAVSHEIRTPLARMRLLVELAGGDGRLAELDKEIVALDALVGELLAVSRVDFGALVKQRISARDVALRALEDARVDRAALVMAGDVAFEGDPTLLVRAVRNLLENAERHGGGARSLRVERRGEEVAFEVEDAGPGIAEAEREKIFEPFHKRSPDAKSVGLGLALVRRIAEAHGGRAYAENRPEGGARVGFALEAA